MRVKCINDKWGNDPEMTDAPRPVFLRDYNALETVIYYGKAYYELAELGHEFLYEAAFFATLPDESTELIEEGIYEVESQTV